MATLSKPKKPIAVTGVVVPKALKESSESTLAFRRFRSKLGELSQLYWFHLLNSEMGLQKANTLNKAQSIVDQVKPSFSKGMFSQTAAEYAEMSTEMIERTRLHLLLLCSANLESYLHDITFAYLAGKGYSKKADELNEIGTALGSPILGYASVPKPLIYAEKLFDVDLSEFRKKWNLFYKIRCVVAHSGGVMTARAKKDLGSMKTPDLHKHLGLTWAALFEALQSADLIVSRIDEKVRSKEITLAEILLELTLLKNTKAMPSKDKVWEFLHKEYGMTNTKKRFRKQVLSSIYNISI